jgi:VWFA-related protein
MATPVPDRPVRPLIAVLVFLAGIAPAVAGDPPEYTDRTNANEVRLNFSAMDRNNHGVATLQASDFAVVDKEVIVRNFQSFTRSDWTKLEIAILVDGSESVTPHFRQELADVLNLVSQTAGIPDENLSMFSFHGVQPVLLCTGNCRTAGTAERLPAGRAGSLTPLFDSIVFASDFLSQHGDAHAQKVLIVFSDGADTISRNSLRDAVEASLRNEVQVDCIDLNHPFTSSPGVTVLQEIASASGGHYFPPPNGAADAINVILEGFQASYTVSYRLPNRAYGFHAVQILPTHNLNLQFRSRSGYYYPDRIR